jgi:hypothetical protein
MIGTTLKPTKILLNPIITSNTHKSNINIIIHSNIGKETHKQNPIITTNHINQIEDATIMDGEAINREKHNNKIHLMHFKDKDNNNNIKCICKEKE